MYLNIHLVAPLISTAMSYISPMKQITTTFDYIIIGAGPAGTAAAITLGQAGKRVALVDKASFPREKTCGDAISAKSYSVLRKLNLLEAFEKVSKQVINGALFSAPNTKEVSLRFNSNSAGKKILGAVLPRKTFDNFLFEEAQKVGVTTFTQHLCISVSSPPPNHLQQVTLRHKETESILEAPVVIGADGAYSQLAKQLNEVAPKIEAKLLSGRQYIENVEGLSDTIEIHFIPEVYPGYLWIFPLSPTTANVGVGIAASLLVPGKDTLPQLFKKALLSPKVKDRFSTSTPVSPFKAWTIPVHYRPQSTLEKEGVFLVGDAAGIVDIFSGEGVGNALKSGHILAKCLLHNCPPGTYTKSIQKEMAQELFLSRAIYAITRKMPWFFNGVVSLCQSRPRLLQWLLDVAMDEPRRKELLNPLNYIKNF